MLEQFLLKARELQASDLHLTVGAAPAVRVQGNLQRLALQAFTQEEAAACIAMLPAGVKQQLERTGEADCAVHENGAHCRIKIFRQSSGYALAVRLLNNKAPSCDALGLPLAVQKLAQLEQGLVLVTGATGSGKSTTLAALVEKINLTRAVHIVTLEDPVEYVYQPARALIHQREVGRDTHSFASGLRSALREDPDIILVGELRDAETISIALTAAETGHLVLATLHTRDAVSSVNRILDVLPEKQQARSQLAECLQAVVCQRLVARADGNGRAAAFEILLATEALRNLIREGRTHQLQTFLQTGSRYGMVTMSDYLEKLRREKIIF